MQTDCVPHWVEGAGVLVLSVYLWCGVFSVLVVSLL